MKKLFLSLVAVAFAASALMAQTPVTPGNDPEEPDRVMLKSTMSKDPTGMDIPTGYDKPQVVDKKHEQCKGHKDGQACDKPADQQCPDCKEKAAMMKKHECKEGQGHKCDKAEGMKHECKEGEGKQCDKAAMMKKHEECKKAEGMKHECKEGEGHQCDKAKGMKHECKEGEGKQCDKAAMMKKHECKEGEAKMCDKGAIKKMHEECKDHKDGQPCTKPADQQCPDCKEKAKKD